MRICVDEILVRLLYSVVVQQDILTAQCMSFKLRKCTDNAQVRDKFNQRCDLTLSPPPLFPIAAIPPREG